MDGGPDSSAAGLGRMPAQEDLIARALAAVADLPAQQHTRQYEAQKRELDAVLLQQATRAQNIEATALSADTTLFGPPQSGVVVHKNMPSSLAGLDRSVTNNKHLTKRVLAAHGLPVATGRMVATYAEALDVFQRIGPPVVTKPLVGSGGRSVSVGITTEAELQEACQEIIVRGRHIVIEEMVPGVDLRIMTIGPRAVAATLRVPANVIGDGRSTIAELVAAKNALRAANTYLAHGPLQITDGVEQRLARKGLGPESVPASGHRVFLQGTANISGGGDNHEITELVHPDLLALAERAAACFPGATHAGMDILAERIDAGLDAQRVIISEVNLNNEIGMHILPISGRPTPVHEMLIEALAPQQARQASSATHQTPPPGVDVELLAGIVAETEPPAPEAPGSHAPGSQAPLGRERDEDLLGPELALWDYTDLHFRGALIFAGHDGQDAVLHRSGRSVVSAELAHRPHALKALADAASIPAVTSVTEPGYGCHLLFINDDVAAVLLVPPSSPTRARHGEPAPPPASPAIGLAGCPFPELLEYARALRAPIGPTPILEVSYALASSRGTRPHWALSGIDPDPVLSRFAFPDRGTGAEVYPAAAAAIVTAGSYLVPRER